MGMTTAGVAAAEVGAVAGAAGVQGVHWALLFLLGVQLFIHLKVLQLLVRSCITIHWKVAQ
jgi:hypothetical protein